MSATETPLLRAQLAEALAEADAAPLEIAILAGLLARAAPDEPALAAARARLVGGRVDLDLDAALDALDAVDEDDDPSESWDALCALDERCAAATFLGRAEEAREAVRQAAQLLRAFPEAWAIHAEAATAELSETAFDPRDPARALWAGVEAAGQPPEGEDADEPGASEETLVLTDLDPLISLGSMHAGIELFAADDLPPEAPWRRLARGEGWELALTEDEVGRAVLLLAGRPGVLTREGQAVEAQPGPVGWMTPAVPGAWCLELDGRRYAFRLGA